MVGRCDFRRPARNAMRLTARRRGRCGRRRGDAATRRRRRQRGDAATQPAMQLTVRLALAMI
eukprot:10205476-Alexandrium_andersonii.AAC.1